MSFWTPSRKSVTENSIPKKTSGYVTGGNHASKSAGAIIQFHSFKYMNTSYVFHI